MDEAFWDSSALVPICVQQPATPSALALSAQYEMAVWWSAPVEMRAAFARLLRMGQLDQGGHSHALVTLDSLRSTWWEVEPDEPLRLQAEGLVDRFPLKAADAQQLAAALAWCLGKPDGRAFLSRDKQLLVAARQLGFLAVSV
jgi:predicted nucleic acid-binding protein